MNHDDNNKKNTEKIVCGLLLSISNFEDWFTLWKEKRKKVKRA